MRHMIWLACLAVLMTAALTAQAPQNPALAGAVTTARIPETNPFTSEGDVRAGEALFQTHCSYCHGSFGEGGRGADLTAGVYRRGGSDAELYASVRNGIPGTEMAPVRVSDEVLVRVVAAAVNPIDAKTRAGRGVAAAITAYPLVLGLDFAGIIEQVPYAAHPLQPGDPVYGMGRVPRAGGSYAEYITVPSMSVAPKPATLDFAEAAAVPVAALTAWGMVVEVAKAHQYPGTTWFE